MKRYVLIMAGGSGLRMAANVPKQFLLLGGRPILMTTVSAFYQYDRTIKIVVVLPASQIDYWKQLCTGYAFDIPHEVVSGGTERFYSVKNGLAKLMEMENPLPGEDLVAVHDAVRPLIDTGLIERCYDAALKQGAVIPVTPLTESLRRILPDGKNCAADRSQYRNVQTPQVFRLTELWQAYQQPYRNDFTDDASVMESFGYAVSMVDGSRKNIKITTPEDLALAEYWMKH